MNLKWVIEGRANTGTFCTAQGALEVSSAQFKCNLTSLLGIVSQLGETYAALATLVNIYLRF